MTSFLQSASFFYFIYFIDFIPSFISILLVDQSANYEAKKVHLDNLYRVVQYCENKADCRRGQQLEYFGERFDSQLCKEMPRAICDNCSEAVSAGFDLLFVALWLLYVLEDKSHLFLPLCSL